MGPNAISTILNLPISQELLNRDLLRMAYVAKDGTPRNVPVAFVWNGSQIVVCTSKNAPKLPSLRRNPMVALTIDTEVHPPKILLIPHLGQTHRLRHHPPHRGRRTDASASRTRKRLSPNGAVVIGYRRPDSLSTVGSCWNRYGGVVEPSLGKGDRCELPATAFAWLTDDPQPGIVLVEFADAYGRPHQLVGKSVYFGGDLGRTSAYPRPTSIGCVIEDVKDGIATVSTELLEGGPDCVPFIFDVRVDILGPV
ncbi:MULTISPECIES: pyridoxamine 5'-phosphate oxidase family protein [unclassified Nocardia]|uniref:pyridoxamine 5'-phosphate oxidase family protein n=1 Tax=unclassified Nocardia TaxID=2637762 RepID=UPI001CE3CF68|nr:MULTISPECIES: pyridoxamine 5'-phosphate oxidase family protein [unclassified Nocardia]